MAGAWRGCRSEQERVMLRPREAGIPVEDGARKIAGNQARLLLCLGTACLAGSLYVYLPILSPHAQSLGASLTLVGVIGGSYAFVQLLTRPVLGLISDRRIGKLIVSLSSLLSAAACLGLVISRRPEHFIAWRALAGLGGACLVAFPAMFSAAFGSSNLARAISLYAFSFCAGQTVSGLLGGALAQWLGWRAPFLLGVVLGLGGALALTFAVRGPSLSSLAMPSSSIRLTSLLGSRLFVLTTVLASLGAFSHIATVYTFVPVRAAELGSDAGRLGFLAAVTSAAVGVGNALCGTLAGRLHRRWVVSFGLGLMGLGIVLVPSVGTFWSLLISQLASGVGWGLAMPVLMAVALDAAGPAQFGPASGLFQWGMALGSLAGPAMGGVVAQWFGLDATFLLSGVCCLVGVAYPLWDLPRHGRGVGAGM
jgi:MFS family permease